MPLVRTNHLTTAVLLVTALFAGCENGDAKSPYDVSVEQRSSALSIPGRVERSTKRIRDHEAKTKETTGKMPAMADKLSDTDWALVDEVVVAADEAGKDGAYAANVRDLEVARAFFEEENEQISRKVGGSMQYAAEQAGCKLEGFGVGGILKKSVEERMDERLKSANDAFLIIDRNRDALNQKNIAPIEDMASKIAEASYVVHIEMPEAKAELEGAVAAAGDARSKIQKLLDEEKEPPKEGAKSSPASQKAQKDRVKNGEDKLKVLDTAEADAKANLADLEQRTKDLQAAYDDALDKLRGAIKVKKK
jgi:ribosomal silencing factor RsfS